MNPKTEARRMRINHWNDEDNVIHFPVNPFEIAKSLGIDVHRVHLDDSLAGFIVREEHGGPVEIYVNKSDSPVRQRFTVAHELGHFAQREGDKEPMGFVDERAELASAGADPHEVWANNFAAELLMPAAIAKKWWAKGSSVDELRRKFNVSTPAMNYRLANLGLLK
ncbi:ImmA/IrrE family metallo-endopeptidase [Rhodococcus maanshanensis]|nr:ImmA/IrrE family metallo-endopeptidase [Rhodococcus maanshanensis]